MSIRKWAPWVVAPALVALVAALVFSIAGGRRLGADIDWRGAGCAELRR